VLVVLPVSIRRARPVRVSAVARPTAITATVCLVVVVVASVRSVQTVATVLPVTADPAIPAPFAPVRLSGMQPVVVVVSGIPAPEVPVAMVLAAMVVMPARRQRLGPPTLDLAVVAVAEIPAALTVARGEPVAPESSSFATGSPDMSKIITTYHPLTESFSFQEVDLMDHECDIVAGLDLHKFAIDLIDFSYGFDLRLPGGDVYAQRTWGGRQKTCASRAPTRM
jgi:hypothetical protein